MKSVIGLILIITALTVSACSQYTCAAYVKHTPAAGNKQNEVKL
ncbi:hypothetical protein [Ohtaekwangia sp.]|jgi:hypothetical protein